jgi:membrane protease YdiL (CAAX protease family)
VRIPRWLAWFLISLTFLTAGLIRQFHEEIPTSPYIPPAAGSLLFAAVLFLLLVMAREQRLGASPGPGVRLGSLTPLLLILLGEKWISLTFYHPTFYWISPANTPPELLDAFYRAFSGAGLLAIVLLVSRFSAPSARRVWRCSRPALWPWAAVGTALAIAGTYVVLWLLTVGLGGHARILWPSADALFGWTLVGQASRAFAEEIFYRGLLLFELQRLAPRLGVRSAPGRRWVALLFTSVLFGMEHVTTAPSAEIMLRRFVFTVALGLLLGIVVLISSNLHLAAGLHAWINWLLLGAVPRFVDDAGQSLLPPGTYIGISMALAFVLLFLVSARQRR